VFWGAERMALTFAHASDGTPAPILIHPADGGPVTIPDAALLFGADFQRDRGDLVLRNEGSPDIRVVDYFDGTPADLQSPEGAVIRGPTVALLAGPEAPGQYAQVGVRTQGDPIGQVESLTGDATVQRADGTVETLGPGSKVFLGDVLQTGAEGRLAVTFVDGTIFTLSAASRMVVDELIYDPAGQDNFGGFNLIQGSFVFIAGQVAKTGGMDVTTPSATMGIKGTTVLVEIDTDNGVATAQVTLLRDPDGDVGRVELFDLSQNLIATITEANASWIVSTVDGETREVERTGGSDDPESVLIAEAVAAYQSAFGRVGQGGSFVELDTILRGGVGGDGEGADGNDVDLDSDDVEELPELPPPPVTTPDSGGTFDEGRNGFIEPVIVVTGDDKGRVADGESTVADGRLAANEPAPGAALTWTGSAAGTFGTFTVSPDGEWRYTASPAIVRLDEGETAVETFDVVITDAAGLTATQTITITVVGAGDDPVAVTPAANTVGTIAEAVGATTGGRLLATDPDAGAVLTWSGDTAGTYGTFTVTPGGEWSYVAGPAVRLLAQGETAAEVFTATVTDQTGRTATQTVTVTIGGANDAPVSTTTRANAAGTVTDGGALLASGRLTASDPDAGATLTWSGGGTSPFGTFTVQPNGTWTFTGNAAIEALPQSARVTETFTATVTDEQGATATQAVVVTILGTNDAPVATDGDFATDKGTPVAGQLFATDVDTGDVLTFGLGPRAPANGTVAIAADGSFTYTPNAGFQGLDSFDFTVSDGQGGTATSRATVAVVSGAPRPAAPPSRSTSRARRGRSPRARSCRPPRRSTPPA
jgi:VCBS repeat-containing protein